jgi:hypothetical protein
LDEAAVARYPERRIVEKGVNRCAADMPAAGACATLVLKVLEKRTALTSRSSSVTTAGALLARWGKRRAHSRCAVARHSVRTGVLLAEEAIGKELSTKVSRAMVVVDGAP